MALTGSAPLDNYLDLLQLDNSGSGLPVSTPQVVHDGAGQASLLALSQDTLEVVGVLSMDVATGVILDTGIDFTADAITTAKIINQADSDIAIHFISDTPEGAVTASPGSVALRDNGGVGTTLYVKETGTGNTGWTPILVVSTFLGLSDTPGTYQASRLVAVNAGGTGLEFVAPSWITAPATPAEGEVLYYDGAAWVALGVGTAGEVLTTQGAGAAPSWGAAADASAIPAPATPAEGGILYYDGAAWDALGVGTAGQVLTTGGTGAPPSWEDASAGVTTFTALSDTPSDFTGHGTKAVRVNTAEDALEFVEFPAIGKAYVTSEYNTGDTFRGKPVYAIVIDFGAGPDNTTKSVASGLGVNDVFHVIDMQVMANDLQYGWIGQEDGANKASFTYNKLDYKVYCTTANDLSGVDYQILLKYIKEPATMAGASPHVIATVSGGTWGGLAEGVHVLSPAGYTFSYSPATPTFTISPNILAFNWYWSVAGTPNYRITIAGNRNSATGRTTQVNFYSRTGTATGTTVAATAFFSASPISPYTQAIGPGDRAFTSFTIGAVTITLGRTSEFPLKPATA